MTVPATWFLLLAGALFVIGAFGALGRRNALSVLIGMQVMLAAVSLTALTLARQIDLPAMSWFVGVAIVVAISHLGVGLAICRAIHRRRRTLDLDRMDLMRG